jgi:hypothetical protein
MTAAALINAKMIQSISGYVIIRLAPAKVPYRACGAAAAGTAVRGHAGWLHHGANTAAMGTSARQLRTAVTCCRQSAPLRRRPSRSRRPAIDGTTLQRNIDRLGQQCGVVRAEYRPAKTHCGIELRVAEWPLRHVRVT